MKREKRTFDPTSTTTVQPFSCPSVMLHASGFWERLDHRIPQSQPETGHRGEDRRAARNCHEARGRWIAWRPGGVEDEDSKGKLERTKPKDREVGVCCDGAGSEVSFFPRYIYTMYTSNSQLVEMARSSSLLPSSYRERRKSFGMERMRTESVTRPTLLTAAKTKSEVSSVPARTTILATRMSRPEQRKRKGYPQCAKREAARGGSDSARMTRKASLTACGGMGWGGGRGI